MKSIQTELSNETIYALITIATVTLIIGAFSLYFWLKIRLGKPDAIPTGFVLLVETIVLAVERLISNLMGARFKKLTPYVIYLFLYINLTNLLGILGPPFSTPLRYVVIVLTLGMVMLLGIFVFGFKYNGVKFVLNYLSPLEWMSTFTAFVSISFRLFGNVFAGFLVFSLIYGLFTQPFWPREIRYFNLVAIFIAPLHLYFDFFSAFLQSSVFVVLTLTYWSLNRPDTNEINNKQIKNSS